MSIEFYSLNELIALGKSVREVTLDSVRLSEINIQGYQCSDKELENWVRLRELNKRFFVAAYVDKSLVGQCGMSLLSQADYEKFKNGDFVEEQILGEPTNYNDELIGYISTLTILSKYRSGMNLKNLLMKFLAQIEEATDEGMLFKAICASAYTKEGAKILQKMGFTAVSAPDENGSVNYSAKWSDIQSSRFLSRIKKRDKRK